MKIGFNRAPKGNFYIKEAYIRCTPINIWQAHWLTRRGFEMDNTGEFHTLETSEHLQTIKDLTPEDWRGDHQEGLQLIPGDIVQLKSGGPTMTVLSHEGEKVKVAMATEKGYEEVDIPLIALKDTHKDEFQEVKMTLHALFRVRGEGPVMFPREVFYRGSHNYLDQARAWLKSIGDILEQGENGEYFV